MNKTQRQVKEFHEMVGAHIEKRPHIPPIEVSKLRERLIQEEFQELVTAMEEADIVEVADALGDLLYVIYGTAISYGLDMEPITDEIHASNMTKFEDGRPVKDAGGKVLKGKFYKRPNLRPIIEAQLRHN